MAKPAVRSRAVDLRRAGWTYSQIARELGVSKGSCSLWLRDVAADESLVAEELSPAELGQLRAILDVGAAEPGQGLAALHDIATGAVQLPADLQGKPETARWLRARGWSLVEIHRQLGVPTSTSSQWCREVVNLPGNVIVAPRAVRELTADRRERRRREDKRAAAAAVGPVSDREVVLAAAIAYWCEGAKDKSYDRREWLSFVNSDPGLIRLWMRFLDLMDVAVERRRLRILIHETGDLAGSTAFWSELTGVPASSFGKPTIKRHQPKTNRRNVGPDYHGCLCVTVASSARLYRVVDGVAMAVMQHSLSTPLPDGDGGGQGMGH